jgi:hypothetical protein
MERQKGYKERLYQSNMFENVLRMMNLREQIKLRNVSDRLARSVPKLVKTLIYECSEDETLVQL